MNYAPKPYYKTAELVERPAIPADLIRLNEKTGEIVMPSADPLEVRAAITRLKDHLMALDGAKVELPVEHIFAKGMYVRKLFIPKGTLLVGKIHKQECVNIVAKGDISVMTETGSMRVQAGFHLVSPAGIQKVGYAHEDTIFTNVFLTDETDIERLENTIACESFEALALPDPHTIEGEAKCLSSQ